MKTKLFSSLAILCFFLLSLHDGFSQSEKYKSGYVITANGDTVLGKLKVVMAEKYIEIKQKKAPKITLELHSLAEFGNMETGSSEPIFRFLLEKPDAEAILSNYPDADKEELRTIPEALNMRYVRRYIGYPDLARDAGISGDVTLRVLVDKEGRYVTHKLIHVGHQILCNPVERYVKYLFFNPGKDAEGNPTAGWINIPFRFMLMN